VSVVPGVRAAAADDDVPPPTRATLAIEGARAKGQLWGARARPAARAPTFRAH